MRFISIKFLIVILIITFCNSKSLSNYLQDVLDYGRDIENYNKVPDTKVDRDIKYNESRTLDVYYDKEKYDINVLKPVVIHIYGGTWKKGSKVKFTKIGTLLEENGYIVVIPNYGLFPFAVFEDMVYDVYSAINWTFQNIRKFGGDPNRVTLTAHSAGAHLSTLTLLKAYLGMENNGQVLKPLPPFEKMVLMAGPYDFDDFQLLKKEYDEGENEKDKNEETNNGILEQLVKVLFRTSVVAPHDVLNSLTSNSVSDSFNVKKFVFYYTKGDEKVPEQSAIKLMNQIKRVCPNADVQYVYKEEDYYHSQIVNGVRSDDPVQSQIYLSLVKL